MIAIVFVFTTEAMAKNPKTPKPRLKDILIIFTKKFIIYLIMKIATILALCLPLAHQLSFEKPNTDHDLKYLGNKSIQKILESKPSFDDDLIQELLISKRTNVHHLLYDEVIALIHQIA